MSVSNAAMNKADKSMSFEKSLKKLNQLIENMESADISLDDSLKHFEEGVALIRDCQKALTAADQKVKILTEKAGKLALKPFEDKA